MHQTYEFNEKFIRIYSLFVAFKDFPRSDSTYNFQGTARSIHAATSKPISGTSLYQQDDNFSIFHGNQNSRHRRCSRFDSRIVSVMPTRSTVAIVGDFVNAIDRVYFFRILWKAFIFFELFFRFLLPLDRESYSLSILYIFR